MKRRLITILLLAFTVTSLAACGNSGNVAESTADTVIETQEDGAKQAATPKQTEPPHEHAYAEEVTTPATCLEDVEATFTCECGDTYTETVPATGHDFSSYVSNEDATYTADGTETATCTCGETDTRVAKGTMLTYTFEDMEATKYAKSTVNVRSLPDTEGEKLGSLSTNDEVKVTGKCTETGWYRIEYADGIAYVSDEYLADEKIVETTTVESTQASTQASSGGISIIKKNGYSYINTVVSSYDEAVAAFRAVGIEPWVTHEENGTRWCYAIICHVAGPTNKGNHEADFDTYVWYNFNGYNWGNRLGTKDGRVYVEDVNGGSWSIQECISNN